MACTFRAGFGTGWGRWLSFVWGIAACQGADGGEPTSAGEPCSRSGHAYLDADGDGKAASYEFAIHCPAGSTPPPRYTGLVGDCDDDDPSRSTYYLTDADGDGFSPDAARNVCGRPDEVPLGAVDDYLGLDCDDSDPTLAYWGRPDADGDGFGVGAPECLGVPLPAGTVPAREPEHSALDRIDCDDSRAEVHPGGLELWSDDLDTDCDGLASPTTDSGDFACEPLTVDATCAVPYLVVVDVVDAMYECYGPSEWWIEVGNRGPVSVPSFTILLENTYGSTSAIEVGDPMEPGACFRYRLPGLAGGEWFAVSVSYAGDNCHPFEYGYAAFTICR